MASGRGTICSVSLGTTWGTAVDVNSTTDGIILTGYSGFENTPDELPDESSGFDYPEFLDAGNNNVTPTLDGWLRWANRHWELIAHCIGDDAISSTAGSNFDHTMDVQVAPQRFSTVAITDTVATVRECPSFIPTGFTLSGESGAFWTFSIQGIGDQILTDNQTNTSLSSVTFDTKILRIPFGATAFRINVSSAGALGSGDVIFPNSISLEFTRPYVSEFLANNVAEGSGEFNTREPQLDGHAAKLRLTVGLPEYTSEVFVEDVTDEVVKKADIVMLGGSDIGGVEFETVTISMPALRIVAAPISPTGPARIPTELVMEGLRIDTAPTGMTGITDLLRLVVRNEFATAYDV